MGRAITAAQHQAKEGARPALPEGCVDRGARQRVKPPELPAGRPVVALEGPVSAWAACVETSRRQGSQGRYVGMLSGAWAGC
jgi:hypothetical protein